jgi:hypothetical protein
VVEVVKEGEGVKVVLVVVAKVEAMVVKVVREVVE